jgi:hypothetical protein
MMRIAMAVGLITGLTARGAVALADDAERIDLAVGETVERDVGFAIGLLCEDLSIVRADLRASTPESNTFSATGIKEGMTRCRVGTAPGRPAYVFEIHVTAARPRH